MQLQDIHLMGTFWLGLAIFFCCFFFICCGYIPLFIYLFSSDHVVYLSIGHFASKSVVNESSLSTLKTFIVLKKLNNFEIFKLFAKFSKFARFFKIFKWKKKTATFSLFPKKSHFSCSFKIFQFFLSFRRFGNILVV